MVRRDEEVQGTDTSKERRTGNISEDLVEGTVTERSERIECMDLTVRTLDNTIDLQSYQAEWEALRKKCGGSIFCSFDWAIEWLRHFDKESLPRVIMVEENGVLVGLAPLALTEQHSMGVKVKRLSLVGDGMGIAELYDLGIFVSEDREDILDKIVQEMGRLDWNVLDLNRMRDCPSARMLFQRIYRRWETEELTTVPCPGTELPSCGSLMDVISPRTKRIMVRSMTMLEEESRIRYRCVDTPDEANEATAMYALKHLAKIEGKDTGTYSNERQSSFLTDVMLATVLEGRGMVYEAWIDGSLAAQMLCLEDGDIMRAFRVGTGERYQEYSPSNLVALYAMNEARHAGFTYFDFGAGAEVFKYRLGARDRPLLRIEAKRGTVRAMSKISSLPGVRHLMDRSGVRQQAQ
ncbi:MAG: GNAT family N-acetyltransferase [Methanomassiliicoccus sp.]|nr:GNAT family N-acetyltransferase [Methanomassiliicoccus sp.]